MIDWGQIVPIVLGIVGVAVGAWATGVKNKAVAEVEQIKAETAQVNAGAEQQSTVTKIAARQQRLLEKVHEEILKRDEQIRVDGLTRDQNMLAQVTRISGLFSDIRDGESNIHNTLRQLTVLQKQMVAATRGMPMAVAQAVAQVNQDANRESMRVLGAELAASFKDYLEHHILDRDLYPFPDAEDPRWRQEFIQPIVPDVVIHKDHRFNDNTKLNKPCATLRPEGEVVLLIEPDDLDRYVIVRKEDCYGFIYKPAVKIGRPDVPP